MVSIPQPHRPSRGRFGTGNGVALIVGVGYEQGAFFDQRDHEMCQRFGRL
jgi:hypothetical protein